MNIIIEVIELNDLITGLSTSKSAPDRCHGRNRVVHYSTSHTDRLLGRHAQWRTQLLLRQGGLRFVDAPM